MKLPLFGTPLVLCTVILVSFSCASGNAAERAPAFGMGKQFYLQYCASCHGKDARGTGPVAKALKKKPADLTRIAERAQGTFNTLETAAFIDGRTDVRAHGMAKMPVWGKRLAGEYGEGAFTEEMISGTVLQIVKYLESLQK